MVKRTCEVIFRTWGFVPTILLLPLYKNSHNRLGFKEIPGKWDSDLNPHFVNCVLCSVQVRIHDIKHLRIRKWKGKEFYFCINNHALHIKSKGDFFFFLAVVGCGMKHMERLFIPANPSQLFNQCKICICWQK